VGGPKRNRITLLAVLDIRGGAIEALRLLPKLPTMHRYMRVRETDDWFKSGVPLEKLSDLLDALKALRES